MKKRGLTMALSLCVVWLAALSILWGGGGKIGPEGETEPATVLRVAATAVPNAELLLQARPMLAQQGIALQVLERGDYDGANEALAQGSADAGFAQSQAYLDNYNAENGSRLVSVAAIHYEPMGIYPGKTSSLTELPVSAYIGIPKDPVEQGRALRLLEAQGLIALWDGAGETPELKDVVEDDRHLQFRTLNAAALPNMTGELDVLVIHGNFAIQAGLSPSRDALALEEPETARQYASVLAVQAGRERDEAVLALAAALRSEELRSYMAQTYSGDVMPVD